MRKIASHYLLLEGRFLKQQVVEINDKGEVETYYALREEAECVEWLPGIIEIVWDRAKCRKAFLLYPYDLISLKPVGETQRTLLR